MDDQGTAGAGGRVRFRKLRIAWSVVCGVLCLLLIALWVRSYRIGEIISYRDPGGVYSTLGSKGGTAYLIHGNVPRWTNKNGDFSRWRYYGSDDVATATSKFAWNRGFGATFVSTPYYLLVTLAASLTAVPWLRWRFSLRTLLIGMTVVAVLFGLIAAAMLRES